jgi:uncharacterized MnhB-related membrane protein
MNLTLLANRRIWFLVGFALLVLLAVSYALTETTLGATLNIQIYFPLVKYSGPCGSTIPCP